MSIKRGLCKPQLRDSRYAKEVDTNVSLPGQAVGLLIFSKVEAWRWMGADCTPMIGRARMLFPQRTLQMAARLHRVGGFQWQEGAASPVGAEWEERGPEEAKSENLSHSSTVFSEELPTPTNLAGAPKALVGASQKIIFRHICSGSVSARETEKTNSSQATRKQFGSLLPALSHLRSSNWVR